MKCVLIRTCALLIIFSTSVSASRAPVNPNATPEAVALLEYLYSIQGRQTLSGQHNVPLNGSTRLAGMEKQYGVYPAMFGQDFGFSPAGTWDGINFRQNIVDEAIRRHHEGFIITIMWHAVRPIEEEPVDFSTGIQGKLTDAEWQDLITPGTEINERWKSQVDVIAFFLKQLNTAGVPVLWRPYHEMNGGWFWWGKKEGEDGYVKLWRMLYDRLTHFHGLNNLLWVYNPNEVKDNVDPYATYYPGHDFVDILATDVYTEGYNQMNYEQLLELAEGRPMGLGEVGEFPTAEILENQPMWTWFMFWHDPYSGTREQRQMRTETLRHSQVINHRDLPWVEDRAPVIHHPVLR